MISARSHKTLEQIISDCIAEFNNVGLEIGDSNTKWSSTTAHANPWLKAGETSCSSGQVHFTNDHNDGRNVISKQTTHSRDKQQVAPKHWMPMAPRKLKMDSGSQETLGCVTREMVERTTHERTQDNAQLPHGPECEHISAPMNRTHNVGGVTDTHCNGTGGREVHKRGTCPNGTEYTATNTHA